MKLMSCVDLNKHLKIRDGLSLEPFKDVLYLYLKIEIIKSRQNN